MLGGYEHKSEKKPFYSSLLENQLNRKSQFGTVIKKNNGSCSTETSCNESFSLLYQNQLQ
jgi:hypothetical protein